RLSPMLLRPDCQGANSPLSVSDRLNHLCAPEPAFFGNSEPTMCCSSRLQRIRGKCQVLGGRAGYRNRRARPTMLVLLSQSLARRGFAGARGFAGSESVIGFREEIRGVTGEANDR